MSSNRREFTFGLAAAFALSACESMGLISGEEEDHPLENFTSFSNQNGGSSRTEIAVTMVGISQEQTEYGKAGDAFLIEDDKTMLIDVGNASSAKRVLVPFLRAKSIRRIDYVLITHAHVDHYGGLKQVLNNFEVGQVLFRGPVQSNPGQSKPFADLLRALGKRHQKPSTGQTINLGLSTMKVVFATDQSFSSNFNDASIITKLEVGSKSILFTGDCGPAEGYYLAQHHARELSCDVLKMPHHAQIPFADLDMLNLTRPSMILVPIWEPHWRYGKGHKDPTMNWYSTKADNFMAPRNPIFHRAQLLISRNKIRFGHFNTIAPIYNLLS